MRIVINIWLPISIGPIVVAVTQVVVVYRANGREYWIQIHTNMTPVWTYNGIGVELHTLSKPLDYRSVIDARLIESPGHHAKREIGKCILLHPELLL